MQRTEHLTTSDGSIGLTGLPTDALRIDLYKGIELRIQPFDFVKV
jgi:hypothetical protein